MQSTCKVMPSNSPTEVLGASTGGDAAALEAQFTDAVVAATQVQSAVRLLEDTARELVLTRRCADVCKVTHLLRTSGDRLSRAALEKFDTSVRTALDHIVAAPLPDTSYLQATLGVKEGGLGLRRAVDLSLPAFVASATESRPAVFNLIRKFVEASVLPQSSFEEFDARLALARTRLWLSVPEGVASDLQSIVDEHADLAEKRFEAVSLGQTARPDAADADASQNSVSLLLQPAGAENPEHPTNVGGLQRALSERIDNLRFDELADTLLQLQSWSSVRRLSELRDPRVSHGWLWALNPAHGPRVRQDRFWTCLRIRLGVDIIGDAVLCPRCNKQVLDTACVHALCCAPGESTRGHNRTRDSALQLVSAADPSAEVEVPGLIPDRPTLRPADIFTMAAIPGCQAALDIGICSPDACGAGADCCESMFQNKLETYGDHLEDLASRGIRYKPLVFSCFGRPHPESYDTLEIIAKQAARRHGVADFRPILRRALDHITVAIWNRAAAMAHACLPEGSPEELGLLFGECEEHSCAGDDADGSDDDMGESSGETPGTSAHAHLSTGGAGN